MPPWTSVAHRRPRQVATSERMKVQASTQALLTGLSRADGFGERSGSAETLTRRVYTNAPRQANRRSRPRTGPKFGLTRFRGYSPKDTMQQRERGPWLLRSREVKRVIRAEGRLPTIAILLHRGSPTLRLRSRRGSSNAYGTLDEQAHAPVTLEGACRAAAGAARAYGPGRRGIAAHCGEPVRWSSGGSLRSCSRYVE
jgi:hypothetical protein